jgi:hypothetical protein
MNGNDSGAGSLRQAIADAHNGDRINFDAALNVIGLWSGELVVDKSVTIFGPGTANLILDGNQRGRLFHIIDGVTVSISGLTTTRGQADDRGGAILNDHSTLTVSDCMIGENILSSDKGGAICNDGASGTATLTINNSTVRNSSSDNRGGGIYNDGVSGSATLTINNSIVTENIVANGGGAIYNDGTQGSATLIINYSTISDNGALYPGSSGGAIANEGFEGTATVTISNSSLSGNASGWRGGGVYNDGVNGSATLTVTNSTVSDNWAAAPYVRGSGGGIYNGWGTLTMSNCTFSENWAENLGGGVYNGGTATIGNTIFKTGGRGGENIVSFGTVTSNGYNLSNDGAGGVLTAMGDRINTDPMLGPLQDNGGPTFTHALLPGSPAIDAGKNFAAGSTDQRGSGFVRTFDSTSIANANGGDGTDIGAYEVQPPTPSYAAQVQAPINPDGSSTFNVRRGVVPVKFNLTQGGVATCDLPPATIVVTRTAGGVIGQVNESDYSGNADTGSNFRIDSCQYVYNLNSRALGVGTYRVDILINCQVVGNAAFALN